MKTSVKTDFAQIFSGGSKIWGSPPFVPPGPYAPLNETKKQLRSSYLLVEDKPHFLPPASEVCHA